MTEKPESPTTQTMPLLLDGKATAAVLGIGLNLLYNLDRSGRLGPMGVRLGSRRLWALAELSAWTRHGCPRRETWQDIWANIIARETDG